MSNNVINFLSNANNDNDDIVDAIRKVLDFFYRNGIIADVKNSIYNSGFDPQDLDLEKFSDIGVDKWDIFCETVKFFFSNFFTSFDVWKKSASAEQRVKSSRFINQFKNNKVQVNLGNNAIDSKSVFDLLKELPMLAPQPKDIENENTK